MHDPSKTPDQSYHRVVVGALVVASVLMVAWSAHLALTTPRIKLDEDGHSRQIARYMKGDFTLAPNTDNPDYAANAMLPGYHLLASAYGALIGAEAVTSLRSFNLLILLLISVVCWRIVRSDGGSRLEATEVTGCVVFFPMLFCTGSLVFTDPLGFLLVILGLQCWRRRNYWLAALFLSLALAVRQNLVVVAGVLLVYGFVQERKREPGTDVKAAVLRLSPLLAPCLLFVAFFVWNGCRVGLDPPGQQPERLSTGNLLFSLVTFALLFWPLLPGLCRHGVERIKRYPYLAIIPLVFIVLCLLYDPSHRWNRLHYLIRNRILGLLTSWAVGRAAFCAMAAAGALAAIGLRFRKPADHVSLLIWPALLVPVVLVEPRYYIPALLPLVLLKANDEHWGWRCTAWGWLILVTGLVQHTHFTTRLVL